MTQTIKMYLEPIETELQNLEEIGGPELTEYIQIMEHLKARIDQCLTNAKANLTPSADEADFMGG